MSRHAIQPEGMYRIPGVSQALVVPSGRIVWFSGVVGMHEDFRTVEPDLVSQTRLALTNIKKIMDAAGVCWNDITHRRILTTKPHEYEAIARVISEVVDEDVPPTETLMGVTGLARPEFLIEIECIAVLPAETDVDPTL